MDIPTFDISLPEQELWEVIDCASAGYLKISHPETGSDNLIRAAYRSDRLRAYVSILAKNNFLLYKHVDGVSNFVRTDAVQHLWHRVRNGEFVANKEGLIYSYERPKVQTNNPKLLVIFSSIYKDIFTSSLMRHFMRNLPKAQMVLTPETGVLRIADLGGVVGGFYLPTTGDPEAAAKVTRLIAEVEGAAGVKPENTVLYGASKGATAAVYHGLRGGKRFVAVDPIVSDVYYETAYRDSHFTATGIFPASKQEVFAQLIDDVSRDWSSEFIGKGWVVVCSERSPQYTYIQEGLIEPMQNRMLFLNSRHPGIDDHPDVAPKTMAWAIMLLNMGLNGMSYETGLECVI